MKSFVLAEKCIHLLFVYYSSGIIQKTFFLIRTILFNELNLFYFFPSAWETSRKCPVYNKKCNYNPIALLCNFSKIFESVKYNYFFPQIRNAGAVSFSHYEFMAGHSTSTNF